MCLEIEKKFNTKREAMAFKPSLAKRNIKVYKILNLLNDSKGYSLYRYFLYEKGNHYYRTGCKFNKKPYKYLWFHRLSIEDGLHAWINYPENSTLCRNECIVEMIISKGSLYYKGMYGDIVTDNLIWL